MKSAPGSHIERHPPHDDDAERIVLGACLRSGIEDSQASVMELMLILLSLQADDFYREAAQTVYTAVAEVFAQERPVTTVTVAGRLRERGQLEQCGGREFLDKLAEDWWMYSHVRDAMQTVADKATLRRMLLWTTQVRDTIYKREHEPRAVISDVAAQAIHFAEGRSGPTATLPKQTQAEDWATVEAALAQDFTVTPARFGIGEIDRFTGGLGNMYLVLLLAMQGAGKTRLATHIALSSAQQFARQAEEERAHVLVFPLEEGRPPWVRNAVAWLAGIDASKLMPGRANKAERDGLRQRAEQGHRKLLELPVVIGENVGNASQLSTLIRIEARRRKLGLIVIDYLQRLGRDVDEERVELGRISLELQALSEKMSVPILLLSQLSFSAASGEVMPYGGRGAAFDASLAVMLDRKQGDDGRKLNEGGLTCLKARPIPEFPKVDFHVSYANGGHYYDERDWVEAQRAAARPGTRLEVQRDERHG